MKYQIKAFKDINDNVHYVLMVRVYFIYWSFIDPVFDYTDGYIPRINALILNDFISEPLKFDSVEGAYEFIKMINREERMKKMIEQKQRSMNLYSLSSWIRTYFPSAIWKRKIDSCELKDEAQKNF